MDAIRAATNLGELIAESWSLGYPQGDGDYEANCPFCDVSGWNGEGGPFKVYADIRIYKCIECGEAGDCFTWLIKDQKMEYPDAVQYLAKRVNMPVIRTFQPATEIPKGPLDRLWGRAREATILLTDEAATPMGLLTPAQMLELRDVISSLMIWGHDASCTWPDEARAKTETFLGMIEKP
jgi:hypothetical protein